jgi:competence protein ComEA
MHKITKYLVIIVIIFAVNSFADPVKINLNTATAAELIHIVKGIGIKRAEAIVLYRKQHGEFHAIEDLSNVPKISKKFVIKNRAILAAKLTLH